MDIKGEMARLTIEEQLLFRCSSRVQPVASLVLLCSGVINRLLVEYSRAKEAAWDEYSPPKADAAFRSVVMQLRLAGDVAAPLVIHVIEADLGMSHEPAALPPGHPESL